MSVNAPVSPLLPTFLELRWLTISERVDYYKCILLYKAVHNMAPSYISDLIHFSPVIRILQLAFNWK